MSQALNAKGNSLAVVLEDRYFGRQGSVLLGSVASVEAGFPFSVRSFQAVVAHPAAYQGCYGDCCSRYVPQSDCFLQLPILGW